MEFDPRFKPSKAAQDACYIQQFQNRNVNTVTEIDILNPLYR